MFRRLSYWLLKRSIRKYGYIAPVLITHDGFVIDGNRRVQACKELRLDVPTVTIEASIVLCKPDKLTLSCPIHIECIDV